MSLINDALKRVKEAQRQAPPSAEVGLQLRPVEPTPPPIHKFGVLLPIALVGLSLLALVLVWVLARRGNASDVLTVRADTAPQQSLTAQTPSVPAVPLVQTAPPANGSKGESVKAAPVAETVGATVAQPTQTSGTAAGVTNSSTTTQAPPEAATNRVDTKTTASDLSAKGPGTNSAPTIQPNAPTPPPLKLQGIVFSKKPSAVISGKTVFVGDRIREFRIVAITPDTAVLAGGGRTNVLSLSE